jgi:carboxypeptidase Taq
VKEHFSQIPTDVSAEKFYLAINKVEAGMIRTEADEVTYPMHVILRYELEKGLIEGLTIIVLLVFKINCLGTVEVDDLPKLWNAKMKEYLGIEPKTDSEGVLQDTHWSSGAIGYFPTYTLGAIYAR